jgi:hypothetical protein
MDKNVYVEIGKITNTAKHVKKIVSLKVTVSGVSWQNSHYVKINSK